MSRFYFFCLFNFLSACQWNDEAVLSGRVAPGNLHLRVVKDIPVPEGYERISLSDSSFGIWLQNVPVRKDDHVYLYNGALKRNQSAQFAVLDISVGKKDLQQCADAVMRLRAEYLFSQKRYHEIEFRDNAGKAYKWESSNNRPAFDHYLETVFGWCGSASLEKQLSPAPDIKSIQPGDVFIKGGFPGHAMIVMDVVRNDKGNKMFMLAQSYMPAQDIHIVRNPENTAISPWYDIHKISEVITPEWTFYTTQLRRW